MVDGRSGKPRQRLRRGLLALALSAVAVAVLLRLSGKVLIVEDPLPPQSDVAIMLDGNTLEVNARSAEALQLLHDGKVRNVLLDVHEDTVWNEPLPGLARRFLDSQLPHDLAVHAFTCRLDKSVDSTAEEALAVKACLKERGWRSVVLVTSGFHTRRARLILRATLSQSCPDCSVVAHGESADGEFQPDGWWRNRRWAKTWFFELSKLIWTMLFERNQRG